MGGIMKLRWKHFLVLVAASLVPLLAVTWITQNASRRLGKTISERAQNTLTDTVRQEMVRATRSYATLSLLGEFACEQSIQRLAAQAELALALRGSVDRRRSRGPAPGGRRPDPRSAHARPGDR